MAAGRYYGSTDDWQGPINESQKNEEFMLKVKALIKSREELKKENAELKDKVKKLEIEYAHANKEIERIAEQETKLKFRVFELESLLSSTEKPRKGTAIEEKMEELIRGFQRSTEIMDKIANKLNSPKEQPEPPVVYSQPKVRKPQNVRPAYEYEPEPEPEYEYSYERPRRYSSQRTQEVRDYRDKRNNNTKMQKEVESMSKDLNDIIFAMNDRLEAMESMMQTPPSRKMW